MSEKSPGNVIAPVNDVDRSELDDLRSHFSANPALGEDGNLGLHPFVRRKSWLWHSPRRVFGTRLEM